MSYSNCYYRRPSQAQYLFFTVDFAISISAKPRSQKQVSRKKMVAQYT